MSTSEIVAVDPTPDDVQYLEDRLYEFNSSVTGITDGEYLAFLVRDAAERIVAGICGNTWGGACEIRQFWVEESQRHHGLGTQLLAAAEREARARLQADRADDVLVPGARVLRKTRLRGRRDDRRPSAGSQELLDAQTARLTITRP